MAFFFHFLLFTSSWLVGETSGFLWQDGVGVYKHLIIAHPHMQVVRATSEQFLPAWGHFWSCFSKWEPLVATGAGTHRSLMARTSKLCGWAMSYQGGEVMFNIEVCDALQSDSTLQNIIPLSKQPFKTQPQIGKWRRHLKSSIRFARYALFIQKCDSVGYSHYKKWS